MKSKLGLLPILFLWSVSAIAQEAPSTLDEVQVMPADTLKVQAWIDLSNAAMRDNFELARAYGDSALTLASQLGDEKRQALAHRQIATAAYYGSQLEDALEHYGAILDYYRRTGDDMNAAKILNNIGLVKRSQAQHDEAMQYFFEALRIKEQFPDTNSLAYTYNTIGETFAIKGDFVQAEEFFQKALAGFRAADNVPMVNVMLLNLGGFYRDQGDAVRALEYIKDSKEYFEVHGPKRELARAHYLLGGLYLDQGDLPKSKSSFLRSKIYFDSLGATMRSLGCVLNLSEVARLQGDIPEAKKLAGEALDQSRAIGTNEQVARALQLLSALYKAEGNYRQAMEYLEAHYEVQDSILNEQSNRTIAELEEKYQSEVKERQLAELSATNQMNELNLKKQREQTRLLLLFAALIGVIALLLFNQYRAKKRHNDLLLEKNAIVQASLEEKEVLLKEIHHRVKNNLQFISSLLNLQSRHVLDPGSQQVLRESKNRIHSMALVHQKLYQEDNLTGVEMRSYIVNLLDSLLHAYQIDRTKVAVRIELDDINLDIDSAMPIGLILNELITNACKYAFAGREKGSLLVELREQANRLRLCVSDDGPGLPADFRLEESEQFGFELVRSLAARLKADIQVESRPGVAIALDITQYQKV